MMLGGSLLVTWSVALVVRLYLPRHLGPSLFGSFNYSDNLAATCFVFLGLGIEVYIQKEIPVRPHHGDDFFGGTILLRGALSVLVFAGMVLIVWLGHRPIAVLRTVLIFGAAQVLVTNNLTLASLLHASRTVGRLSLLNISSKVVWGLGVAVAVVMNAGVEALAFAFFVSELLRTIVLWMLVRDLLGLRLHFDRAATVRVALASLPFYLNNVAVTVYNKVDINIMSFLTDDRELGWYGSAANFANLAMLIAPLMGWVLMPQLSRAAARSNEELMGLLRRSIEGILSLAIPVSLLMGLGADVAVHYVFGPAFGPATASLRILAPMFVLTYLAMIGSTCLIMQGRAWALTVISMCGLALNAALNLLLIRAGQRALGVGGAGITASVISVGTELVVTVVMIAAIGRGTFDRRSSTTLGKSVVACVAVVGLDFAIRPLGPARLVVDAVAYAILVVASGAVRMNDLVTVFRTALARQIVDPGAT